MAKILYENMVIHFYVAHLHAEYDRNADDYKAHRVVQAFDTAQFLENTRGSAAIQILAGDLNTEPGDLAYRVLRQEANLEDSFSDAYERKGTCDCPSNTYSPTGDKLIAAGGEKRIDYILFRGGFKYQVDRTEYKLPLPTVVPGTSHSYSDHEAVCTTLRITKRDQVMNPSTAYSVSLSASQQAEEDAEALEYKSEENVRTIRESITTCDQSLMKIASSRTVFLTLALIILCMLFQFIDMRPYSGFSSVYLIGKVLLCGLVMYFVFMGTIWNRLERNGILSGKLAMQISLYNKYKTCGDGDAVMKE